ncbi:hypothetical protein CICLE_v10026949mg, partial [Citrus x clementina]
MEIFENFLFALLGGFALVALVHAQNQSGFISIDCGAENTTYTDTKTGIKYISDTTFVDTGISKSVALAYQLESLHQPLWNLRSFPEGKRNCYNVKLAKDVRYLIRASFTHGDYDGKGTVPEFDLHLGPNKWESVILGNVSTIIVKEIIHVISSNSTQVCLVNTGSGTPFISTLEFRPLPNNTYITQSGSLNTFIRMDVLSITNQVVRWVDFIPTLLQLFC